MPRVSAFYTDKDVENVIAIFLATNAKTMAAASATGWALTRFLMDQVLAGGKICVHHGEGAGLRIEQVRMRELENLEPYDLQVHKEVVEALRRKLEE